jgi:starch synthase
MYIVQIASECAPVIKAGGLGDVVYGLSRELEGRGHTVELILPKYAEMRYDHVWGMHDAYLNLWVPWYGSAIHCSVYCGWVHGRVCFFIEPHSDDHFFNRGCYYGCKDDAMRFAFFSKAALEFLQQSNKRPDILHCHDWQTGLIPVLLFEIYKHHGMAHQRVCYTIHNFKHQGFCGNEILQATGLNQPGYYFHPDRLQDNFNPFCLNLMKGGIVYSNHVTTVSPHHAWEAHYGDFGYGLGGTLHAHEDKFSGVLNGIDYNIWNPEIDDYLPAYYDAKTLEKKAAAKQALRKRLLLKDYTATATATGEVTLGEPLASEPPTNAAVVKDKPIVAYIGRLDDQKGVHLIHHAIYRTLAKNAQFVLLGSATEPGINAHFQSEKQHLNNHPDVHLELGFNEELSHLIYAGADLIVVPSNFEPCGLTQMIGLKYGTVPVVRGVGGLVDTVFDRDYDPKHVPEERNGFVFYQSDFGGLESALDRAIDLWYEDPAAFQQLVQQGMSYDNSWNHPGKEYLAIYEQIRHV